MQLTIDDVTNSDGRLRLFLGREQVEIPEPVDALVRRLVETRRGKAAVGHTDAHRWLFPGGAPGRPLHPQALAKRLHQISVPARIGRNTALMENASVLPAKVLSDLLGISIGTMWCSVCFGSGCTD